ncbi:acetyl-coenzyme A carboxylase carboxyl transferase subunit alpha, chloroplastic [Olea europaea subsp. europaea]|nr:acetyl-coenzyme A carboxylase carboxyl transferase subunit alpha, chloroplastic [Olea europaea subsp. europaea]
MANETGLDFSDQIISLENKYQQALKDLYTHLTPIQRVNIARHPNRPTFLDHVFNITEKFVELHGDRAGYDDPAVVTGLGTINGRSYMFMGHQKGRNTKENIQRNFGMPTPHGYRKALRMMYYADHHGFPIITFIDTPGAYADLKSEELGQGEAIAQNLRTMFGLKVPIVSIVMGEGGSGGALAIGCANKLLMLENAVFYVASPEACAAILWKTAKASPKAAEKLKITAKELCKLEVADGIIPEPLGGAHADPYWTSQQIKTAIVESMDELVKMDTEKLLKHRAQKFRKLGGFQEGIPIDPKKKVNMKKKEEAIVVSKTSEVELRDEVQKLKQQIEKAGKVSADHPEPGLNEMIEKLKREIDYEYEEAVKAVGLEDKIIMLREEVAKARNLKDQLTPALKEKIEQLNDEFNKNLSTAPNYSSLKYKLDMLEELSNAQNMSEKGTNADKLKAEIDKRFKEVMDRPDLKQKIETVKGEIAKSGVSEVVNLNQDLKEKFVQLSQELESEFKTILESMGLQVYTRSALEAKAKLDNLNEETNMIIEDVINSSNLKDKIDLLKMEVANAGNAPDAESKNKIQALEAEIKQAVADAVSSPELKDKYEKLQAEIVEATKSSVGSDGSSVKQNVEDDKLKHDGSPVEVNSEANRSFV